MTIEELKSNAAAMTAFADGHPVEYKYHVYPDSYQWEEVRGTPTWNFDQILYRPKPVPKTRPWSNRENVPGPVCWLRYLEKETEEMMVIHVDRSGVMFGRTQTELFPFRCGIEYSTDRVTWHACKVTE